MDFRLALLAILGIVGGIVGLLILLPYFYAFGLLSLASAMYLLRDVYLIVFRRRMDLVYGLYHETLSSPEKAAKWRVSALVIAALGFVVTGLMLFFNQSIRGVRTVLLLFWIPSLLILVSMSVRFKLDKKEKYGLMNIFPSLILAALFFGSIVSARR